MILFALCYGRSRETLGIHTDQSAFSHAVGRANNGIINGRLRIANINLLALMTHTVPRLI